MRGPNTMKKRSKPARISTPGREEKKKKDGGNQFGD